MNRIKYFFQFFVFILFVNLVLPPGVTAQKDHDTDQDSHEHPGMVMAEAKEDPVLPQQVKVEEQLGNLAALDTYFTDENGKKILLKTVFDKPVVLLPAYFMCTSVCSFLQAELAKALNLVDQVPGKDFNVITLSFADEEDPTIANTSKKNYNNLIARDFPLENWFYLTGDMENIRKLTDSLGYYFIKKKDHFYIHPSVLVVLARDGKVIRYLYGPNFLPFDLGMAISEADRGEPGISIKRGVLSFCFDYDPHKKTYAFKIFKITGTAVLILLLVFIGFLLYPSKRDKDKKDKTVS
ncbi:MAG: SCO family protein [Proteobacteria bacterium]|nr:SCO family protein [Pseudomonadota bacterium]MBU1586009.1 SCO family protein [Pseudomonadota bacterium]MBU2455853.1 SCO family protein [Pseudomonadota bacterium]MBU2630078.1 SCO family protein [Pseudomonadota bacterium]